MDGLPRFTFREAVAEAFFHDGPYRIFGRTLAPFCYEHYLLLEQWGSPVITGGFVDLHDLQTVILVCSTRNERAFRCAYARRGLYWKSWWRITNALIVDDALPVFRRYLEDYFPAFPMFIPRDVADDEGVPGLAIAAARCLPAFGKKQTMRMPLGEMQAWSMAIAEGNGHRFDNIMKSIDIAGLREIAAEERAKTS